MTVQSSLIESITQLVKRAVIIHNCPVFLALDLHPSNSTSHSLVRENGGAFNLRADWRRCFFLVLFDCRHVAMGNELDSQVYQDNGNADRGHSSVGEQGDECHEVMNSVYVIYMQIHYICASAGSITVLRYSTTTSKNDATPYALFSSNRAIPTNSMLVIPSCRTFYTSRSAPAALTSL